MTRSIRLGLAGAAGSGKDTFGDYLRIALEAEGKNVLITSFAEPIRRICEDVGLDPYTRETKERVVKKRYSFFAGKLIDAINRHLGDFAGEEDLANLFAHFTTALTDGGYLRTSLADFLEISPRRFCQLLGTEGGRAVRTSFWNDVLVARCKRQDYKRKLDIVIVTDVRFPDEALPVDDIITIKRDGIDAVAAHESESHYDFLEQESAWIIENNGSLADLEQDAKDLAEEYK